MNPGRTDSRFQTTSWTLIAKARDDHSQLETLLCRYWSPVYAYLRRSGKRPDEASDLTQSFLSEVFLGRDLIGKADSKRGRFRSFLTASLKRFVVDEHRREHGRDGDRPVMVPADNEMLRAVEPSQSDDPLKAFDRQWAAAVLNHAIENVEADCRAAGMERQWRAFDARELGPAVRGVEPVPFDDLREELGVSTQQEIYSMLQTVKRKVRRALRDEVAQTVDDPEEVDRELSELREYLGV